MLTLCLTIGIVAYMKYSTYKDPGVFVMYLVTAALDICMVAAIIDHLNK